MSFKKGPIVTEVAESSGASLGGGVAVLNASHGQKLLGDWSRDDAGTTRGRDQTDKDGTALAYIIEAVLYEGYIT